MNRCKVEIARKLVTRSASIKRFQLVLQLPPRWIKASTRVYPSSKGEWIAENVCRAKIHALRYGRIETLEIFHRTFEAGPAF